MTTLIFRAHLKAAIVLAIVFTVCSGLARASDADSIAALYDSLYTSVQNATCDREACYQIHDAMIQKDAATLLLDGTICFVKPIFGKVPIVTFRGKGRISMTPPTAVEQAQLARFIKSETLDEEFNRATFFFCDSTNVQLLQGATLDSTMSIKDMQSSLDEAKKYLKTDDSRISFSSFVLDVLDDIHDQSFLALLRGSAQSNDLVYIIDPNDNEAVKLFRSNGATHNFQSLELVSSFFLGNQYAQGPDYSADNNVISIDGYEIDASINEHLQFSADVALKIHANTANRRWASMNLSDRLAISEVSCDGKDVGYYQDGSTVFLRFNEATKLHTAMTVHVSYSGEIFVRQEDYMYLRIGSTSWYPQIANPHRSTFDLRFHTPANYTFQCAGELLSNEKHGDTVISHWSIPTPEIHCSFGMGILKKYVMEEKGYPKVTVLYEKDSRHEEDVAHDLSYSLKFYKDLYGPIDNDTVSAVQINAYHGQAFPRFLHLSFVTFRSGENSGFQQSFVAHEVAHQWWGMSLGWTNYHDQWMSEAFAEYSSMMYMQAILKDTKRFFDRLEKYRDEIVDNRKSFLGNGIDAAPIWLGYRTGTSVQNAGDYEKVIYHKGAWILHMLRNLMMNTRTLSDSAFFAMMHDYYTTWKHKDPTTADFQHTVEKHIGTGMDWFFKEWVYGSSVPHYTVAWKKDKDAAGHYIVQLRVKQENVAPEFTMVVPIRIGFGSNGSAIVRVEVTGAQSTITLPPLGDEPDAIEFSPYDSVLCSIDTEKW